MGNSNCECMYRIILILHVLAILVGTTFILTLLVVIDKELTILMMMTLSCVLSCVYIMLGLSYGILSLSEYIKTIHNPQHERQPFLNNEV